MASRESGDLYLADLDLEADSSREASAPVALRHPVTRDALDLDFEDDEGGEPNDPRASRSPRVAHSFDALPPQARLSRDAVDDDELYMHAADHSSAVPPSRASRAPAPATPNTTTPDSPGHDSSSPASPPPSRQAVDDATPHAHASRQEVSGNPADEGSTRPANAEQDVPVPSADAIRPSPLEAPTKAASQRRTDADGSSAAKQEEPKTLLYTSPPRDGESTDIEDEDVLQALNDEMFPGSEMDPFFDPPSNTLPGDLPQDLPAFGDGEFDGIGALLPPEALDAPSIPAFSDTPLHDAPLPEGMLADDFAWRTEVEEDNAHVSAREPLRDEEIDESDTELDVRDLHAMPWGYPHAESGAEEDASGASTSLTPVYSAGVPLEAADGDAGNDEGTRRESSDSDVFVQGFFQTLAADLPNEPGMPVRLPHSAEGLTLDAIEEDDILASLAPPPPRPATLDTTPAPSTPEAADGGEFHQVSGASSTPPPPGMPDHDPEEDELHDLIHALGFGGDTDETAYTQSPAGTAPQDRSDPDWPDGDAADDLDARGMSTQADTPPDPDAFTDADFSLRDADFPAMPDPRPRTPAEVDDDAWRSSANLPRPPGLAVSEEDRPSTTPQEELPEALLSDIPLPGTPHAPPAPLYAGDDWDVDTDRPPATAADTEPSGSLLDILRDRLLQPVLLKIGRIWNREETPPPPETEAPPAFDPEQFHLGFDPQASPVDNLSAWDAQTREEESSGTAPSPDGGSDWDDADEDLLDFSVPHMTAPGAETLTHPAPLDLPLHPDGAEDEEEEDLADILAGPIDVESAFPEAMDESAAFKQRLSLFDEFDEDDGAHDEKYDDIDALKTEVAQVADTGVVEAPSLTWREKWEILRGFLGVIFGGVARKVNDTLNLGENWWMYVDAIAILILVISLAVIAASLIWF